MMPEKLQFIPEGEARAVDFYVLAQTKLAGNEYVLVTDSPEGDGEALILRARPAAARDQEPADARADSMYEIVEEEQELSAVLLMLRDELEDLGIEIV